MESRWNERICPQKVGAVLQRAWLSEQVSRDEPLVYFHDLELMKDRLRELRSAFPSNTNHAIAVKANPVLAILKECVRVGAGLEAASMGEVELALAAGCPAEKLVFDSPVKTEAELRRCQELGLVLNADSESELERLTRLEPAGMSVGLRVNPVVGLGTIKTSSVAGENSKFGIPIYPDDTKAVELFRRHSWLNGVHLHVGSQGCGLELLAAGVARAHSFAKKVGATKYLDIGGGLPTRYKETDSAPTPMEYFQKLKEEAFSEDVPPQLITEFGRAVQANCGWMVARVEYTKCTSKRNLAIVHVGGDGLLRTIFQPNQWSHEMCVLNADGELKTGPQAPWDIGGPLCFQGDFLAHQRLLPKMEHGDWLLIRDTGAYTMSLWSRFCARLAPPMLGYEGENVRVIRKKETFEELVQFWS